MKSEKSHETAAQWSPSLGIPKLAHMGHLPAAPPSLLPFLSPGAWHNHYVPSHTHTNGTDASGRQITSIEFKSRIGHLVTE